MPQPFGLISLLQLQRAFLVSMIAEHTWKRGALALPRPGTAAQDSGVSVVKGRPGGTLGMFCHLEKRTKRMVACSKQALPSTVRAVQAT